MIDAPSTDYAIGEPLPGTRYVVARKLGQGGMGVVYEVVKDPGIRGAAKVMSAKLAKRAECVQRFYDEAARVARLRHPNIVQVFDYDKLADGTPFFVTELLEGKTLGQLLRELRGKGLVPEHTFAIQTQLLAGLHHAHSLRDDGGRPSPIVHRDIKPENIFLHLPRVDGAEPSVKILDLGISTVGTATTEKQFLGSYPWAAPEQFKLEPATPQTDLYAAGLVLYKMLTGDNPFEHLVTHEEFMRAHVEQEAPPLPEWLPREVRLLLMSALAKDPKMRPRSAYEFGAKLWSLQFVRKGPVAASHEASTTAPTLGTLAGLADASSADTPHGSTAEGMSEPPVEGRSLEVVADDAALDATERRALRRGPRGTEPLDDVMHEEPPRPKRDVAVSTRTGPDAKATVREGREEASTSGLAQSVVGGNPRRKLVFASVIALAAVAALASVVIRSRVHSSAADSPPQARATVAAMAAPIEPTGLAPSAAESAVPLAAPASTAASVIAPDAAPPTTMATSASHAPRATPKPARRAAPTSDVGLEPFDDEPKPVAPPRTDSLHTTMEPTSEH